MQERERGALALFPKWPPHAVTASELCNLQLSNRARAFSLAFAALFFRLLFSHFICSIFACEIEQNEGVRVRGIVRIPRYASVWGKKMQAEIQRHFWPLKKLFSRVSSSISRSAH